MPPGATPGGLSAATEPHPDAFIRFRLSAIDSVPTWETSPYDNRRSPYSKELLRQVPVIRIFGATDKGQRVCAHVHGTFPYVYVEYKGKLDPDSVNDYIRKFGASLNSAMALSLPTKHKHGQTPQYVAFIVLCKGVPFYGYHVGYRLFLKIYMVHPTHKSRLSQCLRSGAVLGTEFDVFEDHIPFLLQFMLDSNLYGCGWVEVGDCLFREGVPEYVPPNESDALYTPPPTCLGPYAHRTYVDLTVPASRIHPPAGPNKASYSALEIDLPASAILNRASNPARLLHHDFVEKLCPDSVERGKLVRSVKELWDDERRRRAARGDSGPYDETDDAPRAFDSRDARDPIWRTEAKLRHKIDDRAQDDLKKYRDKVGPRGNGTPEFATYVADQERIQGKRNFSIDRVKTTFEQVDAIYVSRFEQDERDAYEFGAWAVKGIGTATSREQEKEWEREIKVDVRRLAATQAAADQAEKAARQQAKKSREDFDDDPESAEDPDQETEEEAEEPDAQEPARAPGTQAEALRRSRSQMDRSERRGREAAVGEAEWDKEPSDDEEAEAKYWGLADADTASDRAASEAGSLSPGSARSLSTSPVKAPASQSSSPLKRSRLAIPTPTLVQPPDASARSSNAQPIALNPSIESGSDTETEDTVDQSQDAQPLIVQARSQVKHVAFEAVENNSGSTATSQMSSSAPNASLTSTGDSGSGGSARVSQTPTNSDSTSSDHPLAIQTTRRATSFPLSRNSFEYASRPPTAAHLYDSVKNKIVYKDPYYSKPSDVPRGPREFAGKSFTIEGDTIKFHKPFLHYGTSPAAALARQNVESPRIARTARWEYSERPPSKKDAIDWMVRQGLCSAPKSRFNPIKSQIEGPTQKGDGYKFTPIAGAPLHREKQHMAVLALELHVNTRGKLLPDPKLDAIEAAFYCLQSDNEDLLANGRADNTHVGVVLVGEESLRKKIGPTDYVLSIVEDERELIEVILEKVRFEFDPECLSGFEVHHGSWGYLLERAEHALEWNLVPELGRVKTFDTGKFGTKETDRWGFNQSSTLNFSGRHVLPIWRILKADNKFQQNSFEHIALHVLRLRTPHFSFEKLTEWYTSGDPAKLARVLRYWRNRVEMNVEMLDAAEIIDQNCESARVFGVDFKSVRTRGSQFKVESVMFKIAKPESFLLLSPNRVQVGRQNAAECMPLIMEPQSAFYKGPLLVLDFQSLYPSVMIAYNYCYSTFLGRVNSFKGTTKFGVQTNLDQPPGLLHLLKDEINISPNGMMFLKPEVRKSLLAKMLSELLDTRVMVKSSMKAVASDRALTKLLNARQLALKFLANVTYGYTSATFSGRMPAVEVADAIVQTGRETLERALETIRNKKEWAAEVVYGDTDSLFIYLPGRTKEEAFRIGHEMADEITSQNPRPIKLKFEKVYLPCVLLAKKRYVGFKYERLSDLEPEFDAKGIETVRRDGIPATQKMQETCLKLLFRTSDLSQVKEYCWRQWSKLRAGDVSPQDFIIAKNVKLGSYAEGRDPPPGAVVATRAMVKDHRAEPEYGERVPYILFEAAEGTKQIDRSVSPGEFLANPNYRLDVEHYIRKMMVKPLERIFDLVGARVLSWYEEMPKVNKAVENAITVHFKSDRCVACQAPNANGQLCADCREHPAEVAFHLASRTALLESRQRALHQICSSCSGTPVVEAVACDSLDCPNTYARARNETELAKARAIALNF
ncbi:hypothetical protein JCM11491_005634 [Sporobolomyces phaffii]